MPDVSILMPVRNEELYIQTALDSLYRQTFQNWELIAVDDGSSDKTTEILYHSTLNDKRIHVLRRDGGGLVAALNSGLKLCRAPLIARMDGDDVSHPSRLELQFAYLNEHPEIGLVASNFRHFPRTKLKQGMLEYEKWQNSLISYELISRDLFVESPFVHPGVMMRRNLLEKMGGYENNGWAEDYDLWLRMAAAGTKFARIPKTLIFWRDHPERSTRTMNEYALESFRRCKCHYLLSGFLRNVSDIVIAGAGIEARAWQRLLAETGVKVSCWLDIDPKKVGRILHNAPVCFPEELELHGRKMIVAIGVRGTREHFRKLAALQGWEEGVDFIAVA